MAERMIAAGLSTAGKQELNALAQLIVPPKGESDNFKLNLFPDDDRDAPSTMCAYHFDFHILLL